MPGHRRRPFLKQAASVTAMDPRLRGGDEAKAEHGGELGGDRKVCAEGIKSGHTVHRNPAAWPMARLAKASMSTAFLMMPTDFMNSALFLISAMSSSRRTGL